MKRSADPQPDSKERLLQAAEELFCLVGFQHATVREICQRAQVNGAMVTYYFGGKEQLYRMVLERSLTESLKKPHVRVTNNAHRAKPEERLRAFIAEFLSYALANDPARARTRLLVMRELAEPSPAFDWVLEKMRPVADDVEAMVREFLGSRARDEDVRWCAQSIIGQCLHYRSHRPALERMYPFQQYGPADIQRLADHITRFSLAALRSLQGGTGR